MENQKFAQTKAFLELMRRVGMREDKYQALLTQLEGGGEVMIEVWKRMAKDDWRKYCGEFGVHIYNHLHQDAERPAEELNVIEENREIEQIKAFLEVMREMGLGEDRYQTLFTQIEGAGEEAVKVCKRKTKEDWEKYCGMLFGVDIYNHLHPQGDAEIHVGQLNALQKLQGDLHSPSSFAKHRDHRCWVKFLAKNPNRVVCYRDVSEGFALPVCLLNESFYGFTYDLNNIAVIAEDCNFVMALTASMFGSFSDEDDRRDKFIELFYEYSGLPLICVQFANSVTDGSLLVKGHGVDLFLQLGIVNTQERVICNPLTTAFQLLYDYDHSISLKLAKVFASLKKYLHVLGRDQKPLQPTLNLFIKDKLVFFAKTDNGQDIVVKFCRRYSPDVHSYCHSQGFAPALYAVRDLGSYTMVVMEKLDLQPITSNDTEDVSFKEQARNILQKLKDGSFVHGDLRDCNLYTCNGKLVVIDFDWAGVVDVDVYPPFMNTEDINWPTGASTGCPLQHEHDAYRMRLIFNTTMI